MAPAEEFEPRPSTDHRKRAEDILNTDFRHTAATRMVESEASILAVSRILGHADLKTTMRYAHPEDSLKDAVEKLRFRYCSNHTMIDFDSIKSVVYFEFKLL